MNPSLVIITILIHLAASQHNPASSPSPWYWATTVITETVWTICTPATPTPLTVTNIVLLDAEFPVLTSVTVQPPTSPASCYSLPAPTSSLQVIAFSANQISRDGIANANDPVLFYVANNATSPEYVGTFIGGIRILLDLSPGASAAGRVAILLPDDESLVFDPTGVHHYDAGCRAVSSVMIPSFMDQVLSIASSPTIHEQGPVSDGYISSSHSHSLSKREMQSKNFTVQIVVESIIDVELQGPSMWWGPSPCAFVSRTPGEGEWPVFTWTCEYPGRQSAEKKCEEGFHDWLRPGSNSVHATSGIIQSGHDLFQYLPRFLGRVGGSLTNLLADVSPVMQTGMKWLSVARNAVIDVAELGGESACEALHAFDEYKLVMSDAGLTSGPHTVGAYVSPPVDTIVGILAVHTTRMTRAPPRAVVPGQASRASSRTRGSRTGSGVVSFENVTVTSFAASNTALVSSLTEISKSIGTGKGDRVTGTAAGMRERSESASEVVVSGTEYGESTTEVPPTQVTWVMQ
ncbi:hypothetical protein QBC43DRAFT_270948 [Cladorrhinum sp. PSN259]|nr:hypothetical protein QBC43DRAFT_270948 [Cladorrhinum sp. PSN259]